MQKKRSILNALPGVDCGLCGAPTCESLADDIVRDMGRYSQCVFVQKRMVRKEKMDSEEPFDIMDDIWGRVEES